MQNTMKTGETLYVTVCTNDDNYEVSSPNPFKTKEEAIKDVEKWYNQTMEEYTIDDECYAYSDYEAGDGIAIVEHDGFIETCQMIEVVVP